MKNVGVLGPMGSGKGTAANFFVERYGYKSVTLSDILRAIARKEGLSPTRRNLEKIQKRYRAKYGNDFVIKKAVEKARQYKMPVVLDGIRTAVDAKQAKKELKAKLILVSADPEVRFKRLKKRRRTGFEKTFKDFKKTEAAENRIFKFKKAWSYVDYRVDNSKDKSHLHRQLEKIAKRLR